MGLKGRQPVDHNADETPVSAAAQFLDGSRYLIPSEGMQGFASSIADRFGGMNQAAKDQPDTLGIALHQQQLFQHLYLLFIRGRHSP